MLRRTLIASAGALAAPAIVETANAQSKFDWKQAKGTKLEVNFGKHPSADVMQAHQKEFEELTGIKVGSEQVPEQQQRPKVAMELTTGRPSFDVVSISLHVQKKLIEKGKWMEDLRPYIKDAGKTNPDFDFADWSPGALKYGTASDGTLHTLTHLPDFWMVYWNKALFAEKGLSFPKTMDEMLDTARKLTDPAKGIYGFVARGQKNANVPVFTQIMLGLDKETLSPDGKSLQMESPEAIWAAELYAKLMRECAPPGSIGFNWNECQTSFMQGKIGMWLDGIGFSAPLVDPGKSKVVKDVGFSPMPAGPKARHSAMFCSGLCIPTASKNKLGAWLYLQWATNKQLSTEILGKGAGMPGRASPFRDTEVRKTSAFPGEWFDCAIECQKIVRPGLPEIVAVTEFRDVFGVALTNLISGGNAKDEMAKAMAAFKQVFDKENA
ncbi:MAG: sugar ABC transporter substrate-binding protein [Alphaproteobacteria bacterium]|nr:sugar ABC transporter substrate-binding protein [Alphaproteobacteria bacterium]